MTQRDLLVLLNNQENERAEIAARLKEIKSLENPEMKDDAINYILMRYFQDYNSLRVAV